MVTGKKDTVAYDFKVLVPAPVLSRMKCEYAQVGTEDAIFGDYLLDDPNVPIEVVFSGNVKAQILSSNKNEVRFIVPDGALEGPVTVTTQYGTSRSTFHYLESRGLITSFEASENGGTGYVPGWGRPDPSQIIEDEYSITGKYVRMAGSISPADDKDGWASGGNNFTINIWSCDNDQNPNSGIPNPMITGDLSTLILKCEVNVLETWSASPMIFAFAAATDNEGWLWADGTQPRAFWAPWTSTGSYVSDGWETVSIPLSTMKFNGSGEDVGLPTGLGQLGISVHNRGGSSYIGTPCSPVILIDNIRVVSIE